MKIKAIFLHMVFILVLAGCSRGPTRYAESSESITTNLTITTYNLRNPEGKGFTTIHELWHSCRDIRQLVSSVFCDSHGRIITLTPTPVGTDSLVCDSGVFKTSMIPDDPEIELQLVIALSGKIYLTEVEEIQTKDSAAIRNTDTASVLVVESNPLEHKYVQRILSHSKPVAVWIIPEQGAPYETLLSLVKSFSSQETEIRLAILPWHWKHPVMIVDEKTKQKENASQPPAGDVSQPSEGAEDE